MAFDPNTARLEERATGFDPSTARAAPEKNAWRGLGQALRGAGEATTAGLLQAIARPAETAAGVSDALINAGRAALPLDVVEDLIAGREVRSFSDRMRETPIQDLLNRSGGVAPLSVPEGTAEVLRERAAENFEKAKYNRPEGGLASFAYDVAPEAAIMAGAAGATALTRNPSIGAGIMGSRIYGQTQSNLMTQRGLSAGEATQHTAPTAVLEFVTEKPVMALLGLPIKALVESKALPIAIKRIVQSRGARAGGGIAAEGVQEGFMSGIENAYNKGVFGDDITLGQALSDMGYSTLVGATAASPSAAGRFLLDRPTGAQQDKTAEPGNGRSDDSFDPATAFDESVNRPGLADQTGQPATSATEADPVSNIWRSARGPGGKPLANPDLASLIAEHAVDATPQSAVDAIDTVPDADLQRVSPTYSALRKTLPEDRVKAILKADAQDVAQTLYGEAALQAAQLGQDQDALRAQELSGLIDAAQHPDVRKTLQAELNAILARRKNSAAADEFERLASLAQDPITQQSMLDKAKSLRAKGSQRKGAPENARTPRIPGVEADELTADDEVTLASDTEAPSMSGIEVGYEIPETVTVDGSTPVSSPRLDSLNAILQRTQSETARKIIAGQISAERKRLTDLAKEEAQVKQRTADADELRALAIEAERLGDTETRDALTKQANKLVPPEAPPATEGIDVVESVHPETGQDGSDAATSVASSRPATPPSAPQEAPQVSPEIGLKRNAERKAKARGKTVLDDARLRSASLRSDLSSMAPEAGWSEIGGRLIRDGKGANQSELESGRSLQVGNIVGRTKWIPLAPWFAAVQRDARLPGNSDGNATRAAVQKALNNEPLSAAEKRHIEAMLDWAEEERSMLADEGLPVDPFDISGVMAEVDADEGRLLDYAMVARAVEIDEGAVERAGMQFENDDAAFMSAIRGIINETGNRSEQDGSRREAVQAAPAGEKAGQRQELDETGREVGRGSAEKVGETRGDYGTQEPDMFGNAPAGQDIENERRRRAERRRQQERAAPGPEGFQLSGSDRDTDIATAAGQRSLFDGYGDDRNGEPAEDGNAPAPLYGTQADLIQTGERRLGASRILTPQNAADATAYLARNGMERLDGIVVDADGTPLAVVGNMKGDISSAQVFPRVLVGEAIGVDGATGIWLSHNHPSGEPTLSTADIGLLKDVDRAFSGTRIKVHGILAIGGAAGGERSWSFRSPAAASDSGTTGDPSTEVSTPVRERILVKSDSIGGRITGAGEAAKTIPAIAQETPGIVLLNNQHYPIAFVPWPADRAGRLRNTGALDDLYAAAANANAAAAVIAVPNGAYTDGQLNNLAGALQHGGMDIRVLDAIQYETISSGTARSMVTSGTLSPVRKFAARAGSTRGVGRELVEQGLKSHFGEKGIDNLLQSGLLRIVDSAEQLTESQQRALGSGDALYDSTARGGKGQAYIIADRITLGRLPRVLLHELGEHHGLEGMIGADSYRALQNSVRYWHARGNDQALNDAWNHVSENYPELEAGSNTFVREVIARYAESSPSSRAIWFKKLLSEIRQWLARHGFTKALRPQDIAYLVRKSLKRSMEGASVVQLGGDPAMAGQPVFARPETSDPGDRQNAEKREERPDTIMVDGVRRSTQNSDGRPIHPTEEGIRNFWRFFGGSRVVDADGRPLVVYHGSTEAFDVFDAGEFGFHFGNESAASIYGDARPFYLSIKNPFYIGKDLGDWKPEDMLRWLISREYKGPGTGIPEAQQKKVSARVAKLRKQHADTLADPDNNREYTQALYAIGAPVRELYESHDYDGIRYKNEGEGGESFIAFRPEQIKSATGNTGDFDQNEPSILASRGGQPDEKDLIIQHNLTAENLLHADRMGGLAVPSMAVTRAGSPLTNFGEITLIGDSAMADPRGGTRVFGADIYSPRYPDVTYRLDREARRILAKRLEKHQRDDDRNVLAHTTIGEIDDLTTLDAFKRYAADRLGHEPKWGEEKTLAAELLSDVGAQELLFQGFTNTGNRRYKPHTLENVVRELKKGLRGGEGFNYGVGSLRAKLTPQFRSLAQVRKEKGRLVTKEDFYKVKEEVDKEFFDLVSEISDAVGRTDFGLADAVADMLGDAASIGIPRALARYDMRQVPESVQRNLARYLNKLRDLPTAYFEAVRTEAVPLSAFRVAVAPKGLDPKARQVLERAGLKIVEYENGDVNQARAISQASKDEGLMFSRGQQPDTITVDGVRRSAQNSEGRPIHPTKNGLRNFWKWFKDSKVVDDQGRPLVVYHGTRGDVSKFDPLLTGTASDAGWYGSGFYFTPDSMTASTYAANRGSDGFGFEPMREGSGNSGANVIPVYLSLQNPYDWRSENTRGPIQNSQEASVRKRAELEAIGHDGVLVFMDVIQIPEGGSLSDEQWAALSAASPMVNDLGREAVAGLFKAREWSYRELEQAYGVDVAQAMLASRSRRILMEAVAFRPEQIKSAIGNRGTFDQNDTDIRRSAGQRTATGRTTSEVTADIEARLGKGKIPDNFVVAADTAALREDMDRRGSKHADQVDDTIKGLYDPSTGTSYVVAGNLTASDSPWGLYLHEVGEHYGLERMLGKESYQQVLDQAESMVRAGTKPIRDAAVRVNAAENVGIDPNSEGFDRLFADRMREDPRLAREVIAYLAENPANHNMSLMRRIIAAVRAFMRQLGMVKILTPSDIVTLVTRAARSSGEFRSNPPGAMAQGAMDDSNPNEPSVLASRVGGRGPFFDENRRIREKNTTIWQKAKKMLRRQLMPGGLLPDDVFRAKITRDSEFEAVEFDVRHLVGQLERAVEKSMGSRVGDLSESDKKRLQESLSGRLDESLPDNVQVAVVAMRSYIDRLSTEYQGVLQEEIEELRAADDPAAEQKAQLIETIAANMGQYVHRSYRAFDDANWFKRVPEAVLDAARAYLTRRHIEKGESPAEAARLAEVVLHEILKNGTAYDSMQSFIKESKLGAKDMSVLKRRKEIAPEILALLGEYTDPRINFAKSATKMGRLIWNQRFLNRVRRDGMGVFLFEGTDRPPEATAQIAADGSETYAPLNGLWTFPEIDQSFRDALGKEQMANWYRTIVQLNGVVKFGKTVLSPTTAARNWQSAFFFTLANGHFDMTHMAKSLSGLREYFSHQGKGASLKYLRKLKQLGVIYDTPYAGEMMRLLDDSRIEDSLMSGNVRMKFREAMQYAQKFYQYGDDFWKIIGFENEKQLLRRYTQMNEADIEAEAARRIRNMYPTYSMTGRAVQSLRRFPLAGTFVSFPAEIIRTSINMARTVASDFRTPGMRPLAIRRALGMSIAAGFAHAVQALTKAWFDVDDDDEEAVRELGAPWNRNSNFLFIGRDDDGKLRYFDMSFLDPYNYWKRPINAILRGEPWEETATEVLRELLTPFLGTDIAAGAIFEVVANKRMGTGSEVWNENDLPPQQVADIANHLRKAVQPGVISNLERTWKALDGQYQASGKQYNLQDELMSWVGWRATTIDPKVSLHYRSYEFSDALSDAQSRLYRKLRDPNEVSEREIEREYILTLRQREKAFDDMRSVVAAAENSGLSRREIREALISANVSQQNADALIRGRAPIWVPSQSAAGGASQRARALFTPQKAREIQQRFRYAQRLRNDEALREALRRDAPPVEERPDD